MKNFIVRTIDRFTEKLNNWRQYAWLDPQDHFYFKAQEPLLDLAVAKINVHPLTNSKPTKHCPIPFSVFDTNNMLFRFFDRRWDSESRHTSMSMLNGNQAHNDIVNLLGQIECRNEANQLINFKNIDALGASKSAAHDPIYTYRPFCEFAEFAYMDYLPEVKMTLRDDAFWQQHDDQLLDIFHQVERGDIRISIKHYPWCNRTVINNSGESRRLAACVYAALQSKPGFDQPIELPTSEVTINTSPINDLHAIADTFVFTAHINYIEALRGLIGKHGPPSGYFTPGHGREGAHNDVCVVVILKPHYIRELLRHLRDDTPLQACLYNREQILPQLNILKEHGLIYSLDEFYEQLSSAWKKPAVSTFLPYRRWCYR